MNDKLSIHHIGGRSGSGVFPSANLFNKDFMHVYFDADADCIEQIKHKHKDKYSELHVLPYCFSSGISCSKLNINYDPYTSSLYDFNRNYNNHYYFNGDHDYIYGETCKTMEERNVDLITFDSLFEQMPNLPKPDFLSMDTQGAEWDILNGAKETLKTSVLAVALEVEFHQMYLNQKLFGDISSLLTLFGFQFVKFDYLGTSSPYRASIGLRGEGFQTSGDAFFIKKIENIEPQNNVDHFLKLQKMAFIAILHNQFEYGINCLERSISIDRQYSILKQLKDVPIYCKFISDLEKQIKKVPKYFPPTFAEKYTFRASRNRFDASENKESYIKDTIKKIPWLLTFFRLFRKAKSSIKSELFKLIMPYSNVEKVLINYELKPQADILKRNRLIQSNYIKP